jgi:dihydrolipoamide dehydrogenase
MTINEKFDLVVIGAGPAGYTGAIRAAQLGMRVACIEKRATLGGTCLNVGCIPSKSLLNFSEKFEEASNHFKDIGINVSPKLDLAKMLSKKDQVVAELCRGIDGLFVKNKVKKMTGSAKIIGANLVEIINGKEKSLIEAKNILIATGSCVIEIPGLAIDEEAVVSSTGALALKSVPRDMVIIGAGYIGLELGSVWRRLGSKVTIIEYANKILPALDEEVAAQFTKILQKQNFEFKLNTKVIKGERIKDKVNLTVQNNETQKEEIVVADVALVAIGRKAYSENLGLRELGIMLDNRGQVEVNHNFQTSISNIYAVGDVIKGPMLAHQAEEEAIAAVEIMAGLAGHVNYNIIPSVIYTHPEVASVGLNEQELKAQGISYKVGKFPFMANSRAKAVAYSDGGFVKILADSKSDKILGCHIIGPDAGTLIAELAVAMEFSASSEDIARTCHAHPTLNEAVKEAALAVEKRSINF